ncbi:MAG: hypothetical protein MI742_12620 [Desulfobacterales bacterium]|nr:hypothetical protein [Desulfobacterales bacterium]
MNQIKKRKSRSFGTLCWLVIVLLLLAGGVGCGKKKMVSLHIIPDANANDGRPLYVMVREVNKNTFLTEYYDQVASMLHAENRDEALLGWSLILPGKRKEFQIPRPKEADLAVYGMFTDPGSNWKMRIQVPFKKKYTIKVQGNNLVEVRRKLRRKKDGDA